MKRIFAPLFIFLFCAASSFAQVPTPAPVPPPVLGQPRAVIEPSKTTAQLLEPVWLKTTNSSGKSFSWKVIPPAAEADFTVLPIFGGMDKNGQPIVSWWGVYSSSKPGNLFFVFTAAESDKSDTAVQAITYGGGNAPVVPVPTVPTPSADLVTLVQPITLTFSGSDKTAITNDTTRLANFYISLAKQVQADGAGAKRIVDTAALRQVHTTAGQLGLAGLKGKYPGLGDAVDKVITTKLGLDVTALTDVKRQDAVNTFNAIGWALLQVK